MPEKVSVSAFVTGGQANPGPPLGPALGPLGVNVGAVIAEINKVTSEFSGMKVPVTVTVDPETKKFEVSIGMPPTVALVLKEANAQKGSSNAWKQPVGDVSFEKLVSIAERKMSASKSKDLRSHVLQVLGTCVSVGVTIDGKPPKEVIEQLKSGQLNVPERRS